MYYGAAGVRALPPFSDAPYLRFGREGTPGPPQSLKKGHAPPTKKLRRFFSDTRKSTPRSGNARTRVYLSRSARLLCVKGLYDSEKLVD